jgi:predicted component of viral defense system (DUF524 family)
LLKPNGQQLPLVFIDFTSKYGKKINITLAGGTNKDIINVVDEEEAGNEGEAPVQLQEGCTYEYVITEGYQLEEIPGIVTRSKLLIQSGRITPNIYVGSLIFNIICLKTLETIGDYNLEVISTKASYREDYRLMLQEIAEKSTDLLLQHNSPISQKLTFNYNIESTSAYQRFAFIKSIIDSDEFESSLHRITSAPTTRWKQSTRVQSLESIRKIDKKIIRQLSNSSRRIQISESYSLNSLFKTVPEHVQVITKEETVDTPENRFIKFALEEFYNLISFFTDVNIGSRISKEARTLVSKIQEYQNSELFREVSELSTIPLNNPVLQRKEGYREVFRIWHLFQLASKLIWKGGEDVYSGNKKDVATLYEYWVFFKLLDATIDVFKISPPKIEDLLEETEDGFGLKLRQGRDLAISASTEFNGRRLYVKFVYNRNYPGDQLYPSAGSWSRNSRPDYTLSFWPSELKESEAEEQELIVHIHFDAKYKIEGIKDLFSGSVNLKEEKLEERKGTYKRGDLLKMHFYRDAIRRSVGAYILYPGDTAATIKKGFHEIIPGVGAFAIRPSLIDNGIEDLKKFLNNLISNYSNRASQREEMAYRTYEIYRHATGNVLNVALPENYGLNRDLLPDDTHILIGFYNSEEHLKWILKTSLYNCRTGTGNDSLYLNQRITSARYLLLHSFNNTKTSSIYKLNNNGPIILSKGDLIAKGYPKEPSKEFYLVFRVLGKAEKEFEANTWNVAELAGYRRGRGSGIPFSVSMTKLMKAIVKPTV